MTKLELVGAPLAYIRGPFVAEGFLQGGIGAVLAILVLWLSQTAANAWWGTELRALLDGVALRFLPIRLSAILVLGGMFVGSTGGLAAAWRAGSHPR
jgi:cell division protein FtsX